MMKRNIMLAVVGSIGMQIPLVLTGEDESVLSRAVPIDIDADYDGYSNHWWWDNMAHFAGGYVVGAVLASVLSSRERVLKAFLVLTGGWEVFERAVGERPWHTDESGMAWTFDHAMEDTALDTVMGAAGAYTAASHHFGHDILD